MSLTGMLEIKDSRLRLWWDQELPSIKSHTRAGLWKLPLAAPPPLSAKPEAGLVGTAVDYRMRWLWPCGPARELIGVAYGARMELGDDRAQLLAAEVDAVAGPLAGTHSWDDPTSDQMLARLSLVTARLEAAFRSQMPMDPVTSGIRAELSLEEMMAAQRADLVDDVTAIVAASREHLEPLAVRSAILNPVFAHSGLVGGADADVIVDGCLIDFKTTIRPSLASNELRQLVTYALLDDIEEHKITDVALLFARRPQWLRWSLDELLESAGATSSRGELSASLVAALHEPPPA